MNFTLKKYIKTAFAYLGACVGAIIVFVALGIMTELELGVITTIAATVSGIVLGLPSVYYFIMYFVYNQKSSAYSERDGVVSNWDKGFFEKTARLCVIEDGKEYDSAAIFKCDEARSLVGNHIKYAIIDEMLFIYKLEKSYPKGEN